MSSRRTLTYNAANSNLPLAARIAFSTLHGKAIGPTASTSQRQHQHQQQQEDDDDEDNGNDSPYVTDILSFSNSFIAVNTDNIVKFLDKSTLQTQFEIQPPLASKNDIPQSIKSIARTNDPQEALLITYEDGKVGLFDVSGPSQKPQLILKGPNTAPCLCASSSHSNSYIASGTELYHREATVRIHDLRNPQKPLHIYTEVHSDDVSTLSFHPTEDHLLLSGAMDGLLSTIDVRIADEDDAILHTANVGASLSRVGWMPLPNKIAAAAADPGKSWQGVFGLTNMETLTVFDAADELSVVREYGDVRDIENSQWQTHYVIDCQGVDGGLALFAGSREGGLAIMQVPLEGDWSLEQNLQGGHSDIVRACRLDLSKGSAVSCGEDGQVCLWSAAQSSVASNSGLVNEKSGNNSLKTSSEAHTKSARYTPY